MVQVHPALEDRNGVEYEYVYTRKVKGFLGWMLWALTGSRYMQVKRDADGRNIGEPYVVRRERAKRDRKKLRERRVRVVG